MQSFGLTSCELILHEIGYAIIFGIFFCTLIPSYELWFLFGNSILVEIPALSTALALQTLVWALLFLCVQYVSLFDSREHGKPASKTMYSLYNTMSFHFQQYSFLNIFHGSPGFNLILKLLGMRIEGRALIYPQRIHEFPFITVSDETIIDGSHITGHYVVHNNIKLGPSSFSGILHEGTYAANALLADKESGPLRAFVGGYEIHEVNPANYEENGL